jgi:DNA-directed RNA polymerase subunit E'/Rpb7
MYIGRVRHDGGVVVGKVFPHSFIFQGLWIPSNGTHFQYLSYEVLAFNPRKKEGVDADVDDIFSDGIDVRGNFSEGPVCREGSNNGVRSSSDQEEARSRGVSLSSQNDTGSSLPSCSGHTELRDGNNDN